MQINKVLINQLRQDIESALSDVCEAHGLDIALGHCRYGKENAQFKLEVAIIGEDGEVRNAEAMAFEQSARRYGLQPEDLGKMFTYQGKRYSIAGLKTNRPKFPILATRADGKSYKFPSDIVVKQLALA